MSDIKLKPKKTIKTINKGINGIKDKDNISNNNQENIYSYGDEKISNSANNVIIGVKDNAITIGNKSVVDTKNNIKKAKAKIKDIKAKAIKKRKIKTVSNNLKIKSLKTKNGALSQNRAFNLMKRQGVTALQKKFTYDKS